jgi:hypothetical protein
MVVKWIANWPNKLMNNAGWKIEVNGRTDDSLSRGLDRDTDIKEIDYRGLPQRKRNIRQLQCFIMQKMSCASLTPSIPMAVI